MVRILFLLLLLTAPAAADPALCEDAARRAAAEYGVPADVMLAITLAETGRRVDGRHRPWPWAANLEGAGHWFATRAELAGFAESAVAAGRRSVDIGCFQINWHWHGHHFARPADLADPLTGARHAARFLAALRAERGGWDGAIGAYHSRDPARAAAYAARVAALRTPAAPGRADAWPLPPPGGPGALASLMPAGGTGRPFLAGGRP